ncbi:hypothetical protein FC56_GL001225 [Lentilactobacillus senioris DSM 24302 = JCM 17472]|uniref:EF-hand domain-containing protein n=1 Tax=Lentilactobacillus senioris DSM 24302 = JCM 17472 TaxID=1423802 RepID=A0A0R2CQZ0_9LACO|nr:hypothetical protein [Lentilactobacillus senioris]KRM94273.1 hypothetical protein FC56_GL001225 [Lentilactobacillus senioris DSM 24302 = JCM 17472]
MTRYEAIITPLNEAKTGLVPHGKASFELNEQRLKITVEMTGVPAKVLHHQDIHGLVNNRLAEPAAMTQDANQDGVIDYVEIEHISGQPLIPLNEAPQRLDFTADSYPVANEKGDYDYYKEVGIDELVRNFKDAYNNAKLDLAKRVIYVYGVAKDIELPKTVQGDKPHVMLPIACGQIMEIDEG